MSPKRQLIIEEIPRLRRFARGLVRDPVLADDLVQDCLERALMRMHLWQSGTSMRAWLFTILRNLYINQIRKQMRRGIETPYDEMLDAAGATGPNQEQSLAVRDMKQALAQLPEDQRETLLLVGLEGMSYKETAEIQSVPVGTVMSRLSRGRQALRHLMEAGTTGKPPAKNPRLRRVK
jgi:RNA polymerase sigma-70 factor (ECF subfamily)